MQSSTTPDNKRRALGKGLESLLPSRPAPVVSLQGATDESSAGKPLEIAVDRMRRVELRPNDCWSTKQSAKTTEHACLLKTVRELAQVEPLREVWTWTDALRKN